MAGPEGSEWRDRPQNRPPRRPQRAGALLSEGSGHEDKLPRAADDRRQRPTHHLHGGSRCGRTPQRHWWAPEDAGSGRPDGVGQGQPGGVPGRGAPIEKPGGPDEHDGESDTELEVELDVDSELDGSSSNDGTGDGGNSGNSRGSGNSGGIGGASGDANPSQANHPSYWESIR